MAGGSVLGGLVGGKGASAAAKAQLKAAKIAAKTERYMYDTTRADFMPWRQAGVSAIDALMAAYGLAPRNPVTNDPEAEKNWAQGALDALQGEVAPDLWRQVEKYSDPIEKLKALEPLMGVKDRSIFQSYSEKTPRPVYNPNATPGGTGGSGAYGGFFTSPGYEFRRDEGIKAVERSMASRGLFRSGPGAKAIQRYGEGLAASEYDAYTARLAQLAGLGQSATAGTAAAGSSAAQGIANAQMAAGNARASGYAGTASAINSGINNVMMAYLMSRNPSGGG